MAIGNDANTVALLHCDGANGLTTFTNSAIGSASTFAPSGSAQITTAQSFFNGSAASFNGSGSFLTSSVTSWVFPSSGAAWTFDCRIMFASLANSQSLFWDDGTLLGIAWLNTNNIHVRLDNSGTNVQFPWTPVVSTWNRLTITRNTSNGVSVFVNQSQVGTTQTLGSVNSGGGAALWIGHGSVFSDFNGFMDEICVSLVERNVAALPPHYYDSFPLRRRREYLRR